MYVSWFIVASVSRDRLLEVEWIKSRCISNFDKSYKIHLWRGYIWIPTNDSHLKQLVFCVCGTVLNYELYFVVILRI